VVAGDCSGRESPQPKPVSSPRYHSLQNKTSRTKTQSRRRTFVLKFQQENDGSRKKIQPANNPQKVHVQIGKIRPTSDRYQARTLFSAGSSEICPYRGLRIARIYSKFLTQVTESQVFVNALARIPSFQNA
jgi:hypothetical protein